MRLMVFALCASLGFASLGFVSAAGAKEPAEDKVVCKRQQEADTGSHFATTKKVCMKKSEWKEMEDAVERSMERIRRNGGACPTCLSPGSSVPG